MNVRHRIPTNIQGNIIKMGMNYGKVSENLIHSLAKSKNGSNYARVQKDDGSFIYFPIEPRFLDKHFNMYVAYIQCIRKSSDGKFRKIPRGCCRESERNNIMDYGLDTEITPHRHLKLLQKDNENTCVILNILNAVIRMGDTETYNKMEHLQICSVWMEFVREQTEIHKYKAPEISVVMSLLRKYGYHLEKIRVDDIYTHEFSKYTLCAINISHCIIVYEKEIIDSNFPYTLDLTEKNLNWCCGDNMTFSSVELAYTFGLSKKRERNIKKQNHNKN